MIPFSVAVYLFPVTVPDAVTIGARPGFTKDDTVRRTSPPVAAKTAALLTVQFPSICISAVY